MAASSNSDPKNPRDEDGDSAATGAATDDNTDTAHEDATRDPLILTPDEEAEAIEERSDQEDRPDDAVPEESAHADAAERVPELEEAEEASAEEDAEINGAENAETAEDHEPMPDADRADADEIVAVPVPATEAEPEPERQAEPARSEPVQQGSGGFLPLLLGGVAAAGIGFAVAQYAVPEGWPTPATPDPGVSEALTAQADRIAALEAAIADLPEAPVAPEVDEGAIASAVEAQLGESLRDERTAALASVSERIDALAAEVAALADRPVVEGSAELSDDQIAALQANLDAAVADARAEMEAALEAAAAAEAEADRAAQAASARVALDRIRAAADAGTPYAEALAPIRAIGAEIPDALASPADTGLPALPALQESFPDAARAALEASIRAGGSDAPVDRALAFLRTQTGARSLTPRAGDDPDAILSRAEAALRSGDLVAVLAELDALPEAGQAEMSAWRASAEARAAALEALSELTQALDQT